MIPIFRTKDRPKFFERIEARQLSSNERIRGQVRRIVNAVRKDGDRALARFTEKFDGIRLAPRQFRVKPQELRSVAEQADPAVVRELEKAMFNIRAYHKRQVERSWDFTVRGVTLGQRVRPLGSVGVYIPGGTAAYPSSVLMNVVPAKIAGVPRIVAVTPPGGFLKNPVLAAALQMLHVQEIYLVGGAQAVAALAYGTRTIAPVDKIVGPGNAWVAAAKREVFGQVDIDMIAGPSEVVILASSESNPRFIAADMLAQAEHDPSAASVCFTDSMTHAVIVRRELEAQLRSLPRRSTAGRSLQEFGSIVITESPFQAVEWINEIAPEHLEVFSSIPSGVVEGVRNAGAIFYGDYSPEAVGDYFAGSNHVLPTGGAARYASPLGVYDFLRRTSIISYTYEELRRTWKSIDRLARAEGLEAHSRSVRIRCEGLPADEKEDEIL
jgi:histidinol dehydrogenase